MIECKNDFEVFNFSFLILNFSFKIFLRKILRGRSSVGRAPALQAGGQEFESPHLHHLLSRQEKGKG